MNAGIVLGPNTWRSPRTDAIDSIALGLLVLFAVEVILGGPGSWSIGGVSIRKAFFSAALSWLILMWLVGRIRLGEAELVVLVSLLAYMAVWVVAVPVVRHPLQVPLALQDGSPIATALLGVLAHAFFRRRPAQWRTLSRVIVAALAFVAILNIVLWLVGMTGEEGNFLAQAAALYWFTLGQIDQQPPLYIGTMPDGFFRAMWITGTLYVPALLYAIATRNVAGIVLFAAALLATYTRALWLAMLLGVLLAQGLSIQRQRFINPRLALVGLTAGAIALGIFATFSATDDGSSLVALVGDRIGSTLTDESAGERFEQIGPLIDAWFSAPWIGNGYGAQASLVRSDDAPYSYELTVLALLMKTGVLGIAVLTGLVAALWLGGMSRSEARDRTTCASLAGIVSFLLAAATNPFLINFVGMSALCYMIMKLHIEHPSVQP